MTIRELLAAVSIVRHRGWAFGAGAGAGRHHVGAGIDFGRYGLRFRYPQVRG